MARSVSGGAPPPSRGTRRSFQNRFAESIFGTHPLSAGASAPLRPETKGQATACPDRTQAIPCKLRAATTRSRTCPLRARSRGCRAGGLCPCLRPGAFPRRRSWAGCRSAATWRTLVSTAHTAARPGAGRRAVPGRECRRCGNRRSAWSGTWSGSGCTGRSLWIRRARPGRRTWPRTAPHATADHLGRSRPLASCQTGSWSPSKRVVAVGGHQTW